MTNQPLSNITHQEQGFLITRGEFTTDKSHRILICSYIRGLTVYEHMNLISPDHHDE